MNDSDVGSQYYEIARDTAEIILTKSWKEVRVKDVMLFGSTLRWKQDHNVIPNDIDMLIMHNGGDLYEFDWDIYGSLKDWVQKSDEPVAKGNKRYDAYVIFFRLGFKEWSKENAVVESRKGKGFVADSALQNILRRVERLGIRPPSSVTRFDDRDFFAKMFDVHVLSTGLFGEDSYAERNREEAINSCRDRTFWYTVLRTGKIYNPKGQDFNVHVEERYPGILSFFYRR